MLYIYGGLTSLFFQFSPSTKKVMGSRVFIKKMGVQNNRKFMKIPALLLLAEGKAGNFKIIMLLFCEWILNREGKVVEKLLGGNWTKCFYLIDDILKR